MAKKRRTRSCGPGSLFAGRRRWFFVIDGSIKEVEVELRHASRSGIRDHAGDDLHRLPLADGALHLGGERLHAKAYPAKAHVYQRIQVGTAESTGGHLNVELR
jgi:hypothetical protein